jgi:hypothetical protein
VLLNLWNTSAKGYRLDISLNNFDEGVTAWLEDAYLHTRTLLSNTSSTSVDFSVDANVESARPGRFRIVFKTAAPVICDFTSITANKQENGVQVNWAVGCEKDVQQYEVEKSLSGVDFDKKIVVAARANNGNAISYNWLDENIAKGTNYYRIKMFNKSGTVKYSQVASVKSGADKGEIVVYPNPVKNKTVNLQFSNMKKGIYTARITTQSGQLLLSRGLRHDGGSATQTFRLPSNLQEGVYSLHIVNGAEAITHTLVVR